LFKIGDVVTYKQREDLAEHPTPVSRLGTIVSDNGNAKAVPLLPVNITDQTVIFEVYWWSSKNTVSYAEEGLDYPSLEAR
jgi:hypothetical protein